MRKKFWGIILLLVILSCFAITATTLNHSNVKNLKNVDVMSGNIDLRTFILPEKGLNISQVQQSKQEYNQLKKQTYKSSIVKGEQKIAELTVELGYLQNGDLYYMIRTEGEKKENVPYSFSVNTPAHLERTNYIRFLNQGEKGEEWVRKAYPLNPLPQRDYFAEVDGKTEGYFSMAEVYRLGERMTLISDKALSNPPSLDKGKISFKFYSGEKMVTEQWGMVSSENLVDWQNKIGTEAIKIAHKYKWTIGGMYYPLEETYTPNYKNGYFFNPANNVGESYLRKTDGGRFFEDFSIICLYSAIESQNDQGIWKITIQSNWLYHDYGIPSSYYDTRWCTDSSQFLLAGYQKYRDPLLLDRAKKYGEYLLQHAENHHHSTSKTGILVEDYWHPEEKQKVHSSLNHHLSEMNFLLNLYLETDQKEYLMMADRMKQGVKDVAMNYIKPDGDLWYAYMPDRTFGLMDYPQLTLDDLQRSQDLWYKIQNAKDPDLQFLIEKKKAFRVKTGLETAN